MIGPEYLQNALISGTAVAVLAGLTGYFVVLRGQVFAGDALSHVAYTGALAALAAGIDLRLGLFAATIGVGLIMGLLGGRATADDVVIGSTFSWILGLGVFFLAYYTTHASSANSTANVNVLFGSIFGISRHDALVSVAIAAAGVAALLLIARPLMFASVDSAVARARRVPLRVIGPVFLGIVGVTAAEASQVVGALLLLGLLAGPPAAAQRLTANPWRALGLSVALAVVALWGGIAVAELFSSVPVSFAIIAIASGEYVVALASTRLGRGVDSSHAEVERSAAGLSAQG
jgi:zinc/manganese transport system permease protein